MLKGAEKQRTTQKGAGSLSVLKPEDSKALGLHQSLTGFRMADLCL